MFKSVPNVLRSEYGMFVNGKTSILKTNFTIVLDPKNG